MNTRVTMCAAGASLAALALFACGDDAGNPSGGGGSDGMTSSGTTASGTMVTSSGSGTTTTTTNTTPFDCDPPAEAGSLYELADVPLIPPKDATSMCQYRGEVLLIFNAAAA